MSESDDVMECARAMLRKHGTDAAEVAQLFAAAHFAASDGELGDFWSAIAQAIRGLLGTAPDVPARLS